MLQGGIVMKFEKLNNDKIRIILDLQDLKDNDIDYQSFMANSSDTQRLFMDMLDEAEERIGFTTKDYQIMVEALATIDGNFIITVTRSLPDTNLPPVSKKRNIKIKRKKHRMDSNILIYEFTKFDDFCDFVSHLNNLDLANINVFTKNFSLYTYKNHYYLLMDNINLDYVYLKTFLFTITEFAKSINNPRLFKTKLTEYGSIVIKNNILKLINKHFI